MTIILNEKQSTEYFSIIIITDRNHNTNSFEAKLLSDTNRKCCKAQGNLVHLVMISQKQLRCSPFFTKLSKL